MLFAFLLIFIPEVQPKINQLLFRPRFAVEEVPSHYLYHGWSNSMRPMCETDRLYDIWLEKTAKLWRGIICYFFCSRVLDPKHIHACQCQLIGQRHHWLWYTPGQCVLTCIDVAYDSNVTAIREQATEMDMQFTYLTNSVLLSGDEILLDFNHSFSFILLN